jgi:hypothetical protein
LDDLEICVHLLGLETKWEGIRCALDRSCWSKIVDEFESTDRPRSIVIVQPWEVRVEADFSTPPQPNPPTEKRLGAVPVGSNVSQSAYQPQTEHTKSGTPIQDLDDEEAEASTDRGSVLARNVTSDPSLFSNMDEVVRRIWNRGYGVSVDAVPWRTTQWISVSVWGPGRKLENKFDRASLSEGLEAMMEWLDEQDPRGSSALS